MRPIEPHLLGNLPIRNLQNPSFYSLCLKCSESRIWLSEPNTRTNRHDVTSLFITFCTPNNLTLENILVSTSSPHSDGGGDKSTKDERLSESIRRRFFMCINDMFKNCKYMRRSPLHDCKRSKQSRLLNGARARNRITESTHDPKSVL